jgi:DNA replication protein DnaC
MEHRTVKRLRQVKLSPLAQWYEPWRRDPANLEKSHDAFVEEFCAVLEQSTEQGRIRRLLARARLPQSVCKEGVELGRGISAAQLANLCTGSWLECGHNIVLCGPEGSGKSFLAGALAREVVRHTPRVTWLDLRRFPLEQWDIAQPKIQQLIRPYRTATLLVLDGFADGYIPEGAALVLKDVLDARARRNLSTLVTSHRPVEDWDSAFKNAEVANALFERIFHKAKVIELGARHRPSTRPCRRHGTVSGHGTRPTGPRIPVSGT